MLIALAPLGFSQQAKTADNATLSKLLVDNYEYWRKSMMLKNYNGWKAITAEHRILGIRNRIYSEKRSFPAEVFNVPVAPPSLSGLKVLRARSKGETAKLVCFGKVDFGIDGDPTENLLVLSFVYEGGLWKYDVAEFVNLGGLQDVRKQLQVGKLDYVDGEAFIPSGKKPKLPITVGVAKYIAKVYTYCPGREVNVSVNRISRHRFQDITASEVVIGGARDGMNEIWYSVKDLPGYEGSDPMTIRVYLFSQIDGVKPVKVFQYQIAEGEKPKANASGFFNVTEEDVAQIMKR